MRAINGIIIHCTATRPNWWAGEPTADKVREVRQWHVRDNGWRDIGYHYLIDRDGTLARGRAVSVTGAHARGHNKGTIGIALFGGHGSAASDLFQDNFTAEQDKALRTLIERLRNEHGPLWLKGHNEVSSKACPGFMVRPWFDGKAPAPQLPPETAKPSLWASLALLIASLFGGKK